MDVVSAKLDIIFKKMFLSDLSVLSDFVGALLDIPKGGIQSLEVLNPEILPSHLDGKQGQLDIKMKVDGRIVNVEIQMQNKGDFVERSLFYWARIFSDQLGKGGLYTELKQTICINIINFNLFKCDEVCSAFKLMETTRHEILTDKCAFLYFELLKVNKKINKNNRRDLWLQLLNAETEEEFDMLKETGVPEINKAVVILHEMSKDEKIREMARLREKWIRDENSAIDFAKREGRAEGIEEGIEKGRAEGIGEGIEKGRAEGIAKGEEKERQETIDRLRKKGWSEEEIKEFYGL